MAAIFATEYAGLPAWALESEYLRVVMIPEYGGKIVSLYDRRVDYEWLVTARHPLTPPAYGSIFVEQDMSGWDEMFPTINACSYPVPGLYHQRQLPDHGEAWTLPWSISDPIQISEGMDPFAHTLPGGQKLVLSLEGRILPYHLSRSAWFEKPDCLRLDYLLQNLGPEPVQALWAAHPQFAASADTRILLPETVKEVVNVSHGRTWGEEGVLYPWPEAVSQDGRTWQLDSIGTLENRDCRKFYIPAGQSVSWVGLSQPRHGCSLHMRWQSTELPYLGIWVDEGAFNPKPAAALEPSNGFYDNLAVAVQNRRALLLQPGESQSWSLCVQLSIGES